MPTKEENALYYQEHKQSMDKRSQLWQKENPIRTKELAKDVRIKERIELLKIVGEKCVDCGIYDPRVLQFDHWKGDGNIEKSKFAGHNDMWRYYRKHPKIAKQKLRTRCANCHMIKTYKNGDNLVR